MQFLSPLINKHRRFLWLMTAILFSLVFGLYAINLGAPLIFDDIGFFESPFISNFAGAAHPELPRFWPYATFAHQHLLFGQSPLEMRPVNDLLHALCALALQRLLVRLLLLVNHPAVGSGSKTEPGWREEMVALCVAALFAAHPVAVYAVAYLVQRTILMATLFTLLMWHAFLSALQQDSRRWLVASVVFYYFAVFSKEHAVAALSLPVGLLLLFWKRPDFTQSESSALSPANLVLAFTGFFLIALAATLPAARVLGTDYEPLMKYFPVGADWHDRYLGLERVHWMSILTQSGLFFKYVSLWLWPDPLRMSIDMREPFQTNLSSFSSWLPLLLWLALGCLALSLVLIGRRHKQNGLGLLGVGLLTLQGLFAVELMTVRWQEIFVLYRSYLWMTGLALVVALALNVFWARSIRGTLILAATLLVILVTGAQQRLQTMSSNFLLWNDVVRLIESRSTTQGFLPGDERAYYNRGLARSHEKDYEAALMDYTKAIHLNPRMEFHYLVRAIALLNLGRNAEALADLNYALQLEPDFAMGLIQRALILDQMGQRPAALPDLERACELGDLRGCIQHHKWTKPNEPFVYDYQAARQRRAEKH